MSQIIKTCTRKYSTKLKLPPCDFKPKPYQEQELSELLKIRKNHLNPALTTYYSTPLPIVQGYKQWLFDINGKRYLDMFGGICTVSVGHCHPRITEAIYEQSQTLGHVSNVYLHPKIHEYAEKLINKMPRYLSVVYFVNSGSEANDLAVLMARAYTKNFEFISLKNCYHGMTYETMGLTSLAMYKYSIPQTTGVHNVMNPDVFQGPWGGSNCRDSPVQANRHCDCSGSQCEAKDHYIKQLRDIFKYNIGKNGLAAFFAESIQGVGGTVQFPKGYIKEAYKIVKEHGGLFVSDEVQTGFGRTGEHFWGFEMHGIVPDIVTMAKGIGNGFPLGAVVTTPEVAKALTIASHFNTYGGNPIASTVGSTVLDIIEDERLQLNCSKVGTYFLLELKRLQSLFPIIGDVRGKGLMIGVELVNDENNSPLPADLFMKFWETTRDLGVILGKGGVHGNVIRIKPPMCITKDDVDYTIQVLAESLKQIQNQTNFK